MNLFSQIMSAIKRQTKPEPTNALERLLAKIGIDEINHANIRKGTPINVLAGCKREVIIVPNSSHPARRRDGSVIMRKDKHGRSVPVMQQLGIDKQTWKKMVNDQKRKHAGRWYSGEPADVREARLAARA